jgi:hypothetical protein
MLDDLEGNINAGSFADGFHEATPYVSLREKPWLTHTEGGQGDLFLVRFSH